MADVKSQSALNYLGYSVDERNIRAEQTFIVQASDITIDASQMWYAHEEVEDLAEVGKVFDAQFGVSLTGVASANAYREAHYSRVHRDSAIVMTVAHSHAVSLKQNFASLPTCPHILAKHNLGVRYISKGTLISGFQLVIRGVSSDSIAKKTSSAKVGVDVAVCAGLIADLSANIECSFKNVSTSTILQVEIVGIGGYQPPSNWSPKLDQKNFGAALDALYRDFHRKSSGLPGSFYYKTKDIERIEQIVQFLSISKLNLVVGKNSLVLDSLSEKFIARPTQALRPTEQMWSSSFSLETHDRRYLQIMNGALTLTSRDVTATPWVLLPSTTATGGCFLVGSTKSDLDGSTKSDLDGSTKRWTLGNPQKGVGILLCGLNDSSRMAISYQVLDQKTGKYIPMYDTIEETAEPFKVLEGKHVTITPKEQRQVDYLQRKLFPKLLGARNQSLVMVLGNTGAGKSTMINSLLGHHFVFGETIEAVQFCHVVDKRRPFAEMGTSGSMTLEPCVFPVDTGYLGLPTNTRVALCDLPGFFDSNGEQQDSANAFGMHVVKQLAGSIKAVIVMTEWADLEAGRGNMLKRLFSTLETIFHRDYLNHAIQNLLFVVNLKGLRPESKQGQTIENVVLAKIRSVRSGLQHFQNVSSEVKQALEQEASESGSKHTSKDGWKAGVQKMFLTSPVSEVDVANKEAEVRAKSGAYELLGKVKDTNLIVWHSRHDSEFVPRVWKYVNALKSDIPKSFLRFDLVSENARKNWELLDKYVDQKYTQILVTHDLSLQAQQTLLDKANNDLKKMLEEQRTASIRAKARDRIESLEAAIKVSEEDLKAYENDTSVLRIVEAVPADWKLFKYPTVSQTSLRLATVTHRCISTQPNVFVTETVNDACLRLPTAPASNAHYYQNVDIRFEFIKREIWSALKADDASITFFTLHKFLSSCQGVISEKNADIDRLRSLLEKYQAEFDASVKRVEDLPEDIAKVQADIEELLQEQKSVQKQIEDMRKDFEMAYHFWAPICTTFELSQQESANTHFAFPNMRRFLDLTEKHYLTQASRPSVSSTSKSSLAPKLARPPARPPAVHPANVGHHALSAATPPVLPQHPNQTPSAALPASKFHATRSLFGRTSNASDTVSRMVVQKVRNLSVAVDSADQVGETLVASSPSNLMERLTLDEQSRNTRPRHQEYKNSAAPISMANAPPSLSLSPFQAARAAFLYPTNSRERNPNTDSVGTHVSNERTSSRLHRFGTAMSLPDLEQHSRSSSVPISSDRRSMATHARHNSPASRPFRS